MKTKNGITWVASVIIFSIISKIIKFKKILLNIVITVGEILGFIFIPYFFGRIFFPEMIKTDTMLVWFLSLILLIMIIFVLFCICILLCMLIDFNKKLVNKHIKNKF